jgi:chemotaxis protein methyltransferase CheR
MTTNETLWFRDASPFVALREHIFPKFTEQLRKGEKNEIRVWSAACSTGQEPYSIGISAHEFAKQGGGADLASGRMKILATDISPTALFLAKAGRYDTLSLSRGMPEDLKTKYFDEAGKVFVMKDTIKNMVEFQQINLFKSFSHLGYFDLIMLRNVAIYFSKEFKIDLFKRLAKALKPGGYLVLGASESLYGYSDDFERLQHGNAQFYQVKQSVRTSA